LKKFQANVQNIYKKKYSDSLLVASNSLPSYATQPIVTGKKQNVLSGTFTGDTFTITGTDSSGNAETENITGPGAGLTVTTTKAFLTVTAVSVGSALTGNVEVGFTATSSTEGVVFAGPTRIRGLHGVSLAATAAAAIFRNTSQTGVKIVEMDSPAVAGMMDPYIPDNGCYFDAGAFVDISAGFDSLTVFYDGPNPS